MKKVFLYVSFILIFDISCQISKPSNAFVTEMPNLDFYQSIPLQSLPLQLNDTLIHPINIWCVDSLLIIYDIGVNEGFLRFYSLNSNKRISTFGKIGRGPGEYLSPGIYLNSPHDFLITERSRYSIAKIDSLLQKPAYIPHRKNVHFSFSAVNYANCIHDSILFHYSSLSEQQFSMTHIYTEDNLEYSDYPHLLKDARINDFIANTKVYLSQKKIRRKTKDIAIIAYKFFPILDFVSLKDFKTQRIQFPINLNEYKLKIPDQLNAILEDPRIYYQEVYCTSDYAYCIYYGDTQQHLFEQKTYPEIHQFDWQGNLIQRYKINLYIYQFCVDENNHKMYAIGTDKETDEPTIYSFTI